MQNDESLDFPNQVKICDTQIQGPLPDGTVGIILPRSSASKKGIFVVPGVIDSDYSGVLKIQLYSHVPKTLTQGETYVQLILFPYVHIGKSYQVRVGGFGSTDQQNQGEETIYALAKQLTPNKPLLTLIINGRLFSGLIDTGADISVIKLKVWPVEWPKEDTPAVRGVGGLQHAQVSKKWLVAKTPTGTQTAQIKPVVIDLHLNLWGRDLLSQLEAKIVLDD